MAFHKYHVFLKSIPSGVKLLCAGNVGQFRRYVCVGLLSFALEYSLFYFFFQYCRWWYVWANTASLTPVFWFNFLLNRSWSFQSRERPGRQLIIYSVLFLFNLSVSDFLIYHLSAKLAVDPRFAKIVAVGVIVIWNFIIYKKVIFQK